MRFDRVQTEVPMPIEKPHKPIRFAVNRFMVPAVVDGDLQVLKRTDKVDRAVVMADGELFHAFVIVFRLSQSIVNSGSYRNRNPDDVIAVIELSEVREN